MLTNADVAPPRNNPTRRASSIGPSRATKPTPSSKAPHHSPSATSSYVPTTTPVHGTESVDVSRLETLDLSLADVQRVQQIWAPLPQPPTDKFTRTIDVDVSFGGLSAPEARAALKLGPAFSDPEQQARYETFLHSQAGDSSDHYLVSHGTRSSMLHKLTSNVHRSSWLSSPISKPPTSPTPVSRVEPLAAPRHRRPSQSSTLLCPRATSTWYSRVFARRRARRRRNRTGGGHWRCRSAWRGLLGSRYLFEVHSSFVYLRTAP